MLGAFQLTFSECRGAGHVCGRYFPAIAGKGAQDGKSLIDNSP